MNVWAVFETHEWEYPDLQELFATKELAEEWVAKEQYINYRLAIIEWNVKDKL